MKGCYQQASGHCQVGSAEGISHAGWTAPLGGEHARLPHSVSAEDGNFRSTPTFTFDVFYDNQVYTPNDGRV